MPLVSLIDGQVPTPVIARDRTMKVRRSTILALLMSIVLLRLFVSTMAQPVMALTQPAISTRLARTVPIGMRPFSVPPITAPISSAMPLSHKSNSMTTDGCTGSNSYVCSISSLLSWQATPLNLEQGEQFTSTYITGTWTADVRGNGYYYVGPEGYNSSCIAGGCETAFPAGSLVGKIGDGPSFYIGRGGTFAANASGALYLRMNDCLPCLGDNDGSITMRFVIGPVYSISGRVTTYSGTPISGVSISADSSGSTTTDSTGYYTITGLLAGTYIITPTKADFLFSPMALASRRITVPPDATRNFTGTFPTPFLDLPVAYSTKDINSLDRIKDFDMAAKGEFVNSWFDHSFPTYCSPPNGQGYDANGNCLGENGNLTRWNNTGEGWYDGHNGIDFKHDLSQPNEPVFAAAPGTVVATRTIIQSLITCQQKVGCESGYGNQVWIDHNNGYATLYGHLKTISVTVGMTITTPITQPLGIMGATGRVIGNPGTHLHFGLYYDQNADKKWTQDEAVDPYGWKPLTRPNPSDPWSVPSRYLWRYPLNGQGEIGTAGASVTNVSGRVTVTVPPGTLSSTVTLELWDAPPVAAPSAQLRSMGNSFWLRVLEWLSSGSANHALRMASATPSFNFAQPVTVSMTYTETETRHLDENQLTIYHWDENSNTWVGLPTTVDRNQRQVMAQTTEIGNFDLQAPLLCPTDSQEFDDNYDAANVITADGIPTGHLFDIAEDEDWSRFEAIAGRIYVLQTSNMASAVDTVVAVYAPDGVTLLASDDNSGGGRTSRLEWQAPLDGTYFIRVSQAPGSAFGCSATYNLNISQAHALSDVAINGPTVGLAQSSYIFTATVNPITATLPIKYVWQATGQDTVTHTSDLRDTVAFIWNTPGTQDITVTVTNASGILTHAQHITVYTQVQAAFAANPTSGLAPLTAQYTNTTAGIVTSWLWNFGDGQTSTEANPIHTYITPGTYTVTLVASGPAGSDQLIRTAYIQVNTPPRKIYLPLIKR